MKSSTRRLKAKEVAAERAAMLKEQGGLCPLCGIEIKKGDDTLDHCHDTGHVRAVLHRNCNQIEGRVKSWVKRAYNDPLSFLENLVDFWSQDFTRNPLHPNHKTEAEKEIRKLKRRMKHLKTERAKQRYRDKIRDIQERQ